jgi:hypothetical protein
VKKKKTRKKKFKKKKMMRERKIEIGRDDVVMRYTMRILKRIWKLTIWRCQEN